MSIGPSMPLRLEKPERIDLAQAARYFGARGGADAATQALLEKCAVPLLAAATPRAVWLEADLDSLTAAGILAGEDVAKHLEGCTAALLLAVTLGPGVDAQIRRAGVGDIAAGVASDALGSALAEQAAEAAEAELRQWAARQGKYLTGRYSPGYGDWPLAVQPLLAADPADGSIFHTKKTDRHDSGDHCNDLAFCSCCHGFFLNKAVQMLFVPWYTEWNTRRR